MNILLDEGISDVAKKVNDTLFKAYNKYQYLKGAKDTELNFNKKAYDSDLPKNIDKNKIVDKSHQVKYLDKDELNGFMRFSFDASYVTDEMKRRIDPDNKNDKDSLFQYITDYNDGIVTMTVPMDGYDRRNMIDKTKDKVKDTVSAIKNKMGEDMKFESTELTLKVSDESVMTPVPTPYKGSDNEEELELKESTGYNYRITYYDKDKADYDTKIVTAESAEEAAKIFKENNHSEILEITNDSFTNEKTYYKQGWDNIHEEELELKDPRKTIHRRHYESVSDSPIELALKSYETDNWVGPEEFSDPESYDEYHSYYDMGPEAFYNEFKDVYDFTPEFINNSLHENTDANRDEKVLAVINDVYSDKGNIDSDEAISEIEKRIKQQGITADADYLGDMIIKSAEMFDVLGEGLTKRDTQTLENKLRAKMKEVFLSKFGFEEDDWDEYSYLKITNPFINREGDKGTKIEVRAEVNYDELMYLAGKLDEIITEYDRDAYFEPVTSGIIEAYIWNDNLSKRESLSEGIEDTSSCINLDDADSTDNPAEYVEYLINHELNLDKAKGMFKTILKPIFFKAIKYLNTFKDVVSNFQQRGNTFYIDYQRTITEGNSFKDHHICQGCGKPLSKCTCSIDEDFSGATQVSNIGQHKRDSIDMIDEEDK